LDDADRQADPRSGRVKLHQLGVGRYDVAASVGPSYQSQQAETAEKVIQLVPAIPQIAMQGPDQVLKLMELGPQGEELIKRVTPPQYQEQQAADPQALNQQLQQTQQRVQLLTEQLQQNFAHHRNGSGKTTGRNGAGEAGILDNFRSKAY
jgi:hypothetical protein